MRGTPDLFGRALLVTEVGFADEIAAAASLLMGQAAGRRPHWAAGPRRWREGASLSQVTDDLRRRLGIAARLLPMSDDRVCTRLRTERGWLDFQDYFVRQRCAPAVQEVAFDGIDKATPHPDFIAALRDPGLRAVLLCPSNPFISIEPILDLPGVRAAIAGSPAPVIAVSPIICGRAVKGPTAKVSGALGRAPT